MDKKEYSKEELLKIIFKKATEEKYSKIEENLIHELINGKISTNINEEQDKNASLGERLSDKIAIFGGSWGFIITFISTLIVWIVVNTIILKKNAFDPYPFILLNLALSCLAAIQAPLILMSQNRQSAKDRLSAEDNYLVNFKTEIMIEDIHYKLDRLLEEKDRISELEKELERIKVNQLKIIKQLEESK